MVKKKSLEWQNCSEERLVSEVVHFVEENCGPGVLLLLEGEMGAGKSSFARAVIRQLCRESRSQGSPTFPLVQEYRADSGFPIFHIDLYRLKSEEEIFHSGISEQLDSDDALVLVEWASLFPGLFGTYTRPGSRKAVLQVRISGYGDFRNYSIQKL
jgi:tRNA threonylcarbamoyl adenosine modification protein YjeE